jgi:hypothetical protein
MSNLFIVIIAFASLVLWLLCRHIIEDLRNPIEMDADGNFVKPNPDGEDL